MPGRVVKSGIGMVLLVALLACCESERDRAWGELAATRQRAYRSMWGGTMSDQQIAEERARFECVWAAVDGAGGDPAEDVRCFVRRSDRFVACLERGASGGAATPAGPTCTAESDAVCPLSSAIETAASGPCKRP